MSAAVMQQLGCLQSLTVLTWNRVYSEDEKMQSRDCATPTHLAVAVRQLTALRHLQLGSDRSDSAAALQADDGESVVALLQTIDGLKHLSGIRVRLPVRLKCEAFGKLDMQQLVPNLLARGCKVGLEQGSHGMTDCITSLRCMQRSRTCAARRQQRRHSKNKQSAQNVRTRYGDCTAQLPQLPATRLTAPLVGAQTVKIGLFDSSNNSHQFCPTRLQ
jgi:hypothetical protein